jgi:hypothetical protein
MWIKKLLAAFAIIVGGMGSLFLFASVIGDVVGMLNMMKLVAACGLACVYRASLDWLERQPTEDPVSQTDVASR